MAAKRKARARVTPALIEAIIKRIDSNRAAGVTVDEVFASDAALPTRGGINRHFKRHPNPELQRRWSAIIEPPKMDAAIIERFDIIVAHVRAGETLEIACKKAGIAQCAFSKFLRRDRDRNAAYQAAKKSRGCFAGKRRRDEASWDAALKLIASSTCRNLRDIVFEGPINLTSLRHRARTDLVFVPRYRAAIEARSRNPELETRFHPPEAYAEAAALIRAHPLRSPVNALKSRPGLPTPAALRHRAKVDSVYAETLAAIAKSRPKREPKTRRPVYRNGELRRSLLQSELYCAARAAIPSSGVEHIYEDVTSDLVLQVLAGELAIDQMESAARAAISRQSGTHMASLDFSPFADGEAWVETISTDHWIAV